MNRLAVMVGILLVSLPAYTAETRSAYFAGGCFWCMEADFEKLDGVIEGISGYMGGNTKRPNYSSVSAGGTGHTETVKVIYDPNKVTYAQLLQHFWHNVDPLTRNAQFCDKGSQYRTAIFSTDDEELTQARASRDAVQKELGKPVVTQIDKADNFTEAEDYHQDYYKKKKLAYNYYRFGCGRDKRLKEIWGEKAGK